MELVPKEIRIRDSVSKNNESQSQNRSWQIFTCVSHLSGHSTCAERDCRGRDFLNVVFCSVRSSFHELFTEEEGLWLTDQVKVFHDSFLKVQQ